MNGTMQRHALTVDKFLEHAAKWHGGVEVVSAGAQGVSTITYAGLRERAVLISGGLLSRGLVPGERVATLAWNTADHLALYYAAMGAGLVCHTLDPRFSAEHLTAIVREAADRWIAVGAGLQALLATILPDCPYLEGVILLDGEQSECRFHSIQELFTLEDFIEHAGCAARWGELEENQPASLCYTSGTLGRPRGLVYTHRSNYLHTLRALQADAMALTARDTVLIAVPMFHANGWGLPFACPAVGARMVLPGRLAEASHLRGLIVHQGVTVAAGVRTVWLGLAELLEREGGELPTLKRMVIGGSHCPDALVRRLEERLGVQVAPLGGRTVGRPPLGVDLKLVDAQGVGLPFQRGRGGAAAGQGGERGGALFPRHRQRARCGRLLRHRRPRHHR